MITHLKGTICNKSEGVIVIDVNGIGYKASCSSRTLDNIGSLGTETCLFTELVIREDNWQLFAFASESERSWFKLLLTVQGVGAKIALAILSALNEKDLFDSILAQDEQRLSIAEGVGPKLARRIISELKDKGITPSDTKIPAIAQDVLSALANLGYRRSDALNAVMQSANTNDFESLFKESLNKLTGGK